LQNYEPLPENPSVLILKSECTKYDWTLTRLQKKLARFGDNEHLILARDMAMRPVSGKFQTVRTNLDRFRIEHVRID
jgi:hypothetical protein